MRRYYVQLSALCALFFLSAGPAFASSHGAPVPSDFIGIVAWEIQHFMIHMGLTLQAFAMLPASTELGWTALDGQTDCASMSFIAGLLFSSAWSAIATFMAVLVAGVAGVTRLLRLVIPTRIFARGRLALA
jgi:hypothetical protein